MSTPISLTSTGQIQFLLDNQPPVIRQGQNGDQLTLDSAGQPSWVQNSASSVSKLQKAQFSGANAALPDNALAPGDFSFWLDSTNGAVVLHIKAKSANGTVVNATVAMA